MRHEFEEGREGRGRRHHQHHGECHEFGGRGREGRFAAIIQAIGRRGEGGRHGGFPGGFPGGFGGGRFGRGDDDGLRAGRMIGQADLRLVVLSLISEAPRHGYELIKQIEDLTEGWYVPSPGVIYPTLTFLDEAGYVAAEADGNKKLFSLTETGKAFLDENKVQAEAVIARLKAIGQRVKQAFGSEGGERGRGGRPGREREADLPRSVEAAFLNLREVIVARLEKDGSASADVVDFLLDAARKMRSE